MVTKCFCEVSIKSNVLKTVWNVFVTRKECWYFIFEILAKKYCLCEKWQKVIQLKRKLAGVLKRYYHYFSYTSFLIIYDNYIFYIQISFL